MKKDLKEPGVVVAYAPLISELRRLKQTDACLSSRPARTIRKKKGELSGNRQTSGAEEWAQWAVLKVFRRQSLHKQSGAAVPLLEPPCT